ncbi:MAG: hypothetical protein H7A49_06985 [Akkermansiaceae bacterium]|nr:hypothetical protein [Akkermansiaceae bacterium]
MKLCFAAALAACLIVSATADTTVSPPVLGFATGLPGEQVHLAWASEPGVRYAIEKSTDLAAGSGGGGGGGWTRVAVVRADDTSADWTDPVATETRAFYRISQPQAEVFSIAEPVLSSSGGTLVVVGQCIPDGSFLTLEIDGVGLVSAALVSSGPGQWTATFTGAFPVPGGSVISVISAAITDGGGAEICPVDVDISITETGFAADAPLNSLPPAAPCPLVAQIPVPGVGIIIKKHPGNGSGKRAGPGDYLDDDDDDDTVPTNASIPVPGVGVVIKKHPGSSVDRRADPDDCDDENDDPRDASSIRLAPGRNGMPGEACLEYDALTLACPAGPPVTWTMTYRSMAEVSSGHGPGWDFAYNIYLEAASSTAPTVVIHDGAGRADTFRRAADGTYRADGFSRVGSFSGDTFTLTFANGGTWTFFPLGGAVAPGRILHSTDPNGNFLEFGYDIANHLIEVESNFAPLFNVVWTGDRVTSISDHTGRSVTFSYYGPVGAGGSDGDLKSIGCPTESGLPPAAGDTTFTYTTGSGTPRLNGNLLSITDGAGRVLESLTYATTTTPTDLDFDTLLTQSAHELGHNLGMCHDLSPSLGARVVYENDELGRVTETVFDRMHRPFIHRIHNGFHTAPGGTVSPSDFPLSGKTRSTDPDYFETTWTYNGDSNVTALTGADGSKMLTTYERDLNPACAPIERGNARVQTLVSSIGEKRSITMEYEPDTGTPECARPGNPIGGLTIKVGKNPGGNPSARPGNPIGGLVLKAGKNPGGGLSAGRRRVEVLKSNKTGDPFAKSGITISTSHVEYATADALIWSPRSNYGGPDDDCDLFARDLRDGTIDGWDGTVKGSTRLAGGDDTDEDCDGLSDDDAPASSGRGVGACSGSRGVLSAVRLTRLTTSHGQSFTWTYDAAGNCTSATTPISGGAVYVYDTQGRLTSSTISNGADGDFHDELAYGSDGFLHTYTEDATPGGRNLTTTFEYDTLGRCTRIVDPMTDDWLLTWNALDVCTQTESPPVAGERIATDFAYDASGRLARCDVQLRDSFGNVNPTNPSYSSFWVYDFRGRLSQIATEERPTDTTGLLEPDPLTLENFAVTDFTYNNAGQVIRASTPAACRGQSTDEVVDLTYDERGLLHHVVAGGLGTPGAVTTEYDYDTLGACVREACLAPDGGETLYAYDAFHRPASVTDAMGNEAVFTYDEAGRVTTSFYGETEDLPGDSGNVLLSRSTVTDGGGGRNQLSFGFVYWTDGSAAIIRRMHIKENVEALYDDSISDARTCPPDRPVRCGDGTCAAFFAVYQEDDVIETERFSPGSGTSVLETTVLDRSPAGLLMSVTRNGDLLDSYTYDSSGALSSISNAARTIDLNRDGRQDVLLCGKTEHFRVASPPAPKTFSHTITRDSLGRITAVTDGAGNASEYEYDSLGRVTSATSPGRPPHVFAWDSADVAGPYSVLVSCDIDNSGSPTELGRTLARCGSPVQSADSNGYVRTYTYDALGRPTRCDLPDGTYESTTYDARGFIVSGRFSDGSSLDITTDRLGRRIVITPVNDPPTVIPSPPTNYAYDGLGRLVSAAQGASTVAMTWDSVGNPTSETSNGLTVSRTFNHRGRTSVTYPGGTPISETRNEFGQLTDVGGNLTRYVGMRVYQTEQTNGVVTTYDYRGEGDTSPPGDSSYGSCVRVTSVSGTTTLSDVLLERSPDQRITVSNGRFTDEATGPARIRTYTYDGLGRITGCLTERVESLGAAPVTESDVHYTLDAAGRRLTVTGGAHPGSYTQDSALPTDPVPGPGDHQMGQYTTWPGGNLEWDDRGNLTVIHIASETRDFDCDGDGRLVAVNDGGGTPVVSYTYDALGRLATRADASTITSFVWDGSRMIQELDDPNGTGELSAALTFVCGDGGIRRCISTRNGTLYYPSGGNEGDADVYPILPVWPSRLEEKEIDWDITMGRVHSLTGSSGEVVERYDFDEAGELLLLDDAGVPKTTAIGPVRWMAPESLRDASTGFLHGQGGVYAPPLGCKVTVEKFHVTETYGQTAASSAER